MVLERLHVLNLDDEHIARLRGFNLKRPGEIVYLG